MKRRNINNKQPCMCGHGKSIHILDNKDRRVPKRAPCGFPECTCKDYLPANRPAQQK